MRDSIARRIIRCNPIGRSKWMDQLCRIRWMIQSVADGVDQISWFSPWPAGWPDFFLIARPDSLMVISPSDCATLPRLNSSHGLLFRLIRFIRHLRSTHLIVLCVYSARRNAPLTIQKGIEAPSFSMSIFARMHPDGYHFFFLVFIYSCLCARVCVSWSGIWTLFSLHPVWRRAAG